MVSKSLVDSVRENIYRYELIKPGDKVIAGISGGADSVCLLLVLWELGQSMSFSTTAVHVNHMMRGPESDGDEAFVRALCHKLGVPLRVYSEDVRKLAKAQHLSCEEAGRETRYRLLNQALAEEQAQVIAVAHHSEDNAETVFMNILRGCGVEGLCGMSFSNRQIIRPLLNLERQEIEAYLKDKNQDYREDSSNRTNDYTRNRVRNLVFPFLRDIMALNPIKSLNRLSRLAAEDQAYLEKVAVQAFDRLHSRDDNGNIAIKKDALVGMEQAISGRIIRLAWERLKGNRKQLEHSHVEKMLRLCQADVPHRTLSLPHGLRAWTDYQKLYLGVREEPIKQHYDYPIRIPGMTEVSEANGFIKAELLKRSELELSLATIKENSSIQLFDYLKLECGINIRNRREGDRICPRRSPGEKKLKAFFIDRKVPLEKRDSWPLVAMKEDILWVVGMRTSQKAAPDDKTQHYLKLTWLYNA